jgi:hypothetical protein
VTILPANANARVVRVTFTLTSEQARELEKWVAIVAPLRGEETAEARAVNWALSRLFVALQAANSAR